MPKLERKLNLRSIIFISLGSMLGSGIFVLPGIAFNQTGPSLWLAYLLAALSILPAAMSKIELATAMPTTGGTYIYLERTFGPFAGTIAGLGLWLSVLLKSAFALDGIGAYLDVLTHFPLKILALVLLGAIVVLNIVGVSKVSGAVAFLVTASVTGLMIISTGGLFTADLELLDPFTPNGIGGLFAASALVFVSYAGITKVAAIAEEVKEPEKNLPRGILLSLFISTAIYCIVSFTLVVNIEAVDMTSNLRPVYTLAEKLAGNWAGIAAAVLAILTMAAMANAGILAASRFPFAMARDSLLPSGLGKLSERFLTPVWSIALSGLVVASVILLLDITKIAKLASAFMIMIYISENVAVIFLRELRVQWYKPRYRSPLYPTLQLFGIISGLFFLAGMGSIALNAILLIGAAGSLLYFFYSRHRTSRRGVVGIRGRRKELIQQAPPLPVNIDAFSKKAHVVVCLFGKERSPEMLVELGIAMGNGSKVEVVHLKEVPEQTDLQDLIENSSEVKSLRRRFKAMAEAKGVQIEFDPIISHDIYKVVNDISQELNCNWLVKEWGGKTHGTFTIHNQMGWLEDHISCNLLTYRDAGVRYIRKIMVLLKAQQHHSQVIDVADHLGRVYGAKLTLVGCGGKRPTDEFRRNLQYQLEELQSHCEAETSLQLVEAADWRGKVVELTADFDLLVMPSDKDAKRIERLMGTDLDHIIAKAACSVVIVQSP